MTWTLAGSLVQLRAQVDALAPRRSKASDGTIGDAAHATRDSDHNPWLVLAGQAYVTAWDATHDPPGGLDCDRLAAAVQRGRDPRVKYVIWDRRIMAGAAGPSPWTWRPYAGANPHTKHLHLSVVGDARALVRTPWTLPGVLVTPTPAPRQEDDMTPDERAALFEVRDMLRAQKPGVALPGRSLGLSQVVDDQFGWTMTAAGRADDAARLAAEVLARLDPAALAAAVAAAFADRLRE